ncbi:MAG: diguanylate cyclase [Planctomycetia bacterium]|nr:diguanylate cyclase [Planctomycetia bacterium]
MGTSYQFGIDILAIVAVVQFLFGAVAVWLFSGGNHAAAAATAEPGSTEIEQLRQKQREDSAKIEEAMQQVFRLTGRIGHDVGEHSARVKQINEEITGAAQGTGEDLEATILAAVAKVTEANEKLQGELRSAEAKLAEQSAALQSQMEMARTDALTGALNRRAFDDEMQRRVSEYQRYRTPVSLLLFDIDHFKKFNDTYGHQTGDDVLCHVACTLSMVMRDVDLVCRYGGEEFAIILPATDAKGALLAAERARTAIERMVVESSGQLLKVTISGGVAEVMPNEDLDALVARTDQGLYASKKAGRNCVHLHDGKNLLKNGKAEPAVKEPVVEEKPKNEPAGEVKDPLNSLPNRDAFGEDVRRRVEQHHKYQAPVTVLYCGVDNFPTIVERFGREAGNVVLRAVAQFLKAVLRDQEMLARVAEDRFGITMAGVTASDAKSKIERIRQAIEKCRIPLDGLDDLRFTASFGLTDIEAQDDADGLMVRGAAAYETAAKNGNSIHVVTDAQQLCETR